MAEKKLPNTKVLALSCKNGNVNNATRLMPMRSNLCASQQHRNIIQKELNKIGIDKCKAATSNE